jgi:hypothetical protein
VSKSKQGLPLSPEPGTRPQLRRVERDEDEDVVTSVSLTRGPGTSRMWLAGSMNDAVGFVYRSR